MAKKISKEQKDFRKAIRETRIAAAKFEKARKAEKVAFDRYAKSKGLK